MSVPLAYQQSDASGTVTQTDEGWKASGDFQELGPNVFALPFNRESDPSEVLAAKTVGTYESPLISGPTFAVPRFVLVDRKTGEVVNGSFWSGEMCQEGESELNCWNLDSERIAFSGNGESVLSDDYEWVAGRDATLTLRNMQAPARCKLIDEEVSWRWTTDTPRSSDPTTGQAEAWGAGIFKYYEEQRTEADSFTFAEQQVVYGIPVDCNPVPICSAADLPTPEVSSYNDPAVTGATNRYTMGPTDLYPLIFVLARDSLAVLPDTTWGLEFYARGENSNTWYQVEDTQGPITLGVDGEWYSETVPIPMDAEEFYVVARQLHAPLGYVPNTQVYVFHGVASENRTETSALWDWTGFEGAEVTFNQETSQLAVDYSDVVTDPSKQTLLPYGSWAFAILNATENGDECVVPEAVEEQPTSQQHSPTIAEPSPVPAPSEGSSAVVTVPAPSEGSTAVVAVPAPNEGSSAVVTTQSVTSSAISPTTPAADKQQSRGILARTGVNITVLGLIVTLLLSAGGLLVLQRTRD